MDGLLIDTEAVYLKAYLAAAAHMKVELPLAFCHSLIGRPGPDCDRMIQEFLGPAFELDAFNDHADDHVARALEANVPVKPGAAELLAFLRSEERRVGKECRSGRVRWEFKKQ